MYSKQASNLLAPIGAEVGDRVRVVSRKQVYEGLLMPRIGTGDTGCLTIKLSNGYNIGIDSASVSRIELVEKASKVKPMAKEREAAGTVGSSKNDIVILGCGGTIASKIEYKTGAVHPAMTTDELISSFPKLKGKSIRSRMLFSLLSEDMTPEHWQKVAEETAAEIKKGCRGVVLMHGTDTMHFTSAALSFMLKTPVPVVLVGSQRSSDRGSSDSEMNLMCAVAAAESDIAEVMVCMHATENDDVCHLHRGTRARKMHTSRRDAFQSINVKPLAQVWPDGKIEPLGKHVKRGERKLAVDTKISTEVRLVYTYPGMPKGTIEGAAKKSKGIVIAGTGLGHVPTALIPEVKALVDDGTPVVIAPQTIYGRLNLNVYDSGRKLNAAGAIGHLCDWTPETALVKLMFVLGHAKKTDEVKKMMLTDMAGEITERSESGTEISRKD